MVLAGNSRWVTREGVGQSSAVVRFWTDQDVKAIVTRVVSGISRGNQPNAAKMLAIGHQFECIDTTA